MTVHHAELADVHSMLEAELLGDSPFRALADAHLVRSVVGLVGWAIKSTKIFEHINLKKSIHKIYMSKILMFTRCWCMRIAIHHPRNALNDPIHIFGQALRKLSLAD